MTGAVLTSQWASLLVGTLADAGVTDVVISPGSRSAPLVHAALNTEGLRLHRVIDERCAAFFALGQAKTSGKPSALICTSGSAPAHYFPAVIEASLSRTPLLVLSADRPPELQGNGASQTIDQARLYGTHVNLFVDVAMPDGHGEALRGLRERVIRAVNATLHPAPGAVHLNVPFRKPLEPAAPSTDDERLLGRKVAALRARPVRMERPIPVDEEGVEDALDELERAMRRGGAPVIAWGPETGLSGDRKYAAAQNLATSGFPIFAEAASPCRFCGPRDGISFHDGFDTFLRSPLLAKLPPPAAVIRLGGPLTSKGWEIYSKQLDVPRFVVSPYDRNDPFNSNAFFARSTAERFLERLSKRFARAKGRRRNLSETEEFFRDASLVVKETLAASYRGEGPVTGGALARAVVSALPAKSLLILSNSLPVRDIDMFTAGMDADLVVVSRRPVSGIDGIVSSGAGAASVFDGPATVYTGDIAFFHDIGGLALAGAAKGPFVVVVANNRGGRIFEQLPIAETSGVSREDLEWWTTPHEFEPRHAARLYGAGHTAVGDAARLGAAIRDAHEKDGCTIIEARIDPATVVPEQARLRETVFESLENRGA